MRMNRSLLDMAGLRPEDLVQDTFSRAFDRAHTYNPGDALEPEAQRRLTRAWLGRIASRLLADALRRPGEVVASPLVERAGLDADRQSSPPSSRSRGRLQLICDGLDQLTDREQDVLRITALYQKAGDAHQRLPNEASAELATRWGTTNENIRAIRSRAMKKLKAFLFSRGVQPGEPS
jgi:RNA polymerase sigma factor (sigma-70 family)